MSRVARFVLCALVLGCHPSGAPTPAAATSGAYVIRLGVDTMSVESYTRSGDRIEGVVVRRVPRTVVMRYVVTLAPTGLASRLVFNTRLPDGSNLLNGADSVTVTFTGDSAITRTMRNTVETNRVAAVNGYPDLGNVMSLYALPIAALNGMKGDSVRFRAYTPGAAEADVSPVVRKASNRYWLYSEGSPIEIVTDDRGSVISVDGSRTTYRILTTKQPSADIPAIAAAFAQRERQTGPIVALSLRDTVNATVGSARLWVDYGRPATRGRTLFGPNGVLGDTLWRTGANQATKFRTDAALSVAGRTLPAGTYTLITLAVPGRYQLIFYDGAREVLRVPLRATPLPRSVERFTIAIESAGGNTGSITLRWDTLELSAPFSVP